jgi:hypothetical protein
MSAQHVLEIRLPEGARPAPDDIERLRVALQAIVNLHDPGGVEWQTVLHRLESEGWAVRCELMWHVEARRGREREEACGKTRDDAFARVDQTTRAPSLEGCP